MEDDEYFFGAALGFFEVPLCSPGPLETGIALEIAHCLLQAHHLAKQPCPVIPLQAQS